MARNSGENAGKKFTGFKPLADMASTIVDPILRRRAGLNVELLESWQEMVGMETAQMSQPLKIVWPRRHQADDPFEPATLVIACEGFAAMRVQHETSEIIQRINAFFGFCAINRIKIEQRQIRDPLPPVKPEVPLEKPQVEWLEDVTATIADEVLRDKLKTLGKSILSDKNRQLREKS